MAPPSQRTDHHSTKVNGKGNNQIETPMESILIYLRHSMFRSGRCECGYDNYHHGRLYYILDGAQIARNRAGRDVVRPGYRSTSTSRRNDSHLRVRRSIRHHPRAYEIHRDAVRERGRGSDCDYSLVPPRLSQREGILTQNRGVVVPVSDDERGVGGVVQGEVRELSW